MILDPVDVLRLSETHRRDLTDEFRRSTNSLTIRPQGLWIGWLITALRVAAKNRPTRLLVTLQENPRDHPLVRSL